MKYDKGGGDTDDAMGVMMFTGWMNDYRMPYQAFGVGSQTVTESQAPSAAETVLLIAETAPQTGTQNPADNGAESGSGAGQSGDNRQNTGRGCRRDREQSSGIHRTVWKRHNFLWWISTEKNISSPDYEGKSYF